jgi:alpha,alpha-trehalase
MSGWDFSTRWFADGKNIQTIITTDILPVDLNCLMAHLEESLSAAYSSLQTKDLKENADNIAKAAHYAQLAAQRKKVIESVCWNPKGYYADYDFKQNKIREEVTMAAMSPLFFRIASNDHAYKTRQRITEDLLKPGGFICTPVTSGQQWDAPNGWAPLQWMGIIGLENYGYTEDASDVAKRWIGLNRKVYQSNGKLMEKYNVVDLSLESGGGEYPTQDGFGWTNGVLVALSKRFMIPL